MMMTFFKILHIYKAIFSLSMTPNNSYLHHTFMHSLCGRFSAAIHHSSTNRPSRVLWGSSGVRGGLRCFTIRHTQTQRLFWQNSDFWLFRSSLSALENSSSFQVTKMWWPSTYSSAKVRYQQEALNEEPVQPGTQYKSKYRKQPLSQNQYLSWLGSIV